jgi:DNA-binding transcriptional LysR family regulator
MCHMIAANLGIGVVPLAACKAQVAALDLKVVRLRDAWATRRLLMATKTGATLSPATQLLVKQLFASSN